MTIYSHFKPELSHKQQLNRIALTLAQDDYLVQHGNVGGKP